LKIPCVLTAILLCAIPSAHSESCPSLTPEANALVERFARFHFRIDSSVDLRVNAEALVGCFYRIRVRAVDRDLGLVGSLMVTPDQKYVATDINDLRVDPVEESRIREEALAARLQPQGAPVRGDRSAPVSVVVFSDFQCPYCRKAAALLAAEATPGTKVAKLVFRHFPLPMHDWASAAAEASVCASIQSESYFWLTHDYFFQHQEDLSRSDLGRIIEEELSKTPGFSQIAFRECLSTGAAKRAVNSDVEFGLEIGVQATPTVFVNGVKMNWTGNPDQLRTIIRQAARAEALKQR
jgi:protein-disulfide isomerase